jgi:Protein of unknown function (DUF4242)
VTLYLVEHHLGDVGEGHRAALRDALLEIASRLDGATDGQRIRYLRSTVVTGQDRCICLFDASSEALVRRANELAQVPIASIGPAVDYDLTDGARGNQ